MLALGRWQQLRYSSQKWGSYMAHSYHSTVAVTTALVLAGFTTIFAQGTPPDSQAIRSLIQAHAAAWNHRDAKAAAAIMTPDAVWITSSGATLRGRAEIERAHLQWLAEDSATGGSKHSHPPETITIRFLRADVAVADLGSRYVAPPKPGEQAPAPQTSFLFIALTKDAGQWRIAQVRNTISPRP